MHYQCSLAAAAGSRCTGARSGVVTERGSRGIGAAQKVTGPPMGGKHKERGPEEAPFRHDAELQQRAPRGSAKTPVAMGSGMSEWSSIESAEIWQPRLPG